MGEIDMGNPGVLRDFIAWGEQNYPADHYCVVVWNHGSGWRSTSSLSTSRNVSFDDTSGTSIRTVDLPYALSGASAPIDLVAFDASLMQMLEVAYEIRNDALYMVGSEESPPGEGYNYDDWLHALYSNPGMTAPQLGRSISDNFVANYTGRTYVTQSVVNLSAVPTLAAAVDQLGTAIRPHAVTQAGALAAARQTAQSYKFSFYKDLLDYSVKVKNTLSDPAVTAACTQVQSALSQAVVYETHTGAQVSGSHGLSIYVPTPVEYVNLYSNLSINQDYPNWDTWLRAQRE
jgi:hypothetical protein